MYAFMGLQAAVCRGGLMTVAACVPTAVVSYLAIRWLEERRNRK